MKRNYLCGEKKLKSIKIQVHNISKTFQSLEILQNISFDIFEQEIVCLVGPTGCGKTTLTRIMACLETPDKGKILLDGKEISIPTNKIGYVPQGESLLPWRSVFENISLGLEISREEPQNYEERIYDLCRWIGLTGFENNLS